jgi:hypothetical protein
MKHSIIVKLLIGLFIISLPKWSVGNGKPYDNISFRKNFINAIDDTIPKAEETSANANNKKKEEKIKVLPKPRRQSVPVPINVKVVPVIKPVIKPIIKILH